jgi:uncharacterized membrane protein YkoI
MNTRNRNIRNSALLLLVVCLLSFGPTRAQDDEKAVKMNDLPQAVQATIREQSKGGAIRGISQEKRSGQTVYEVEFETGGRVREALIDQAGKVVEIEDQITLDSLPPAVKTEIVKQAAQGKLLLVASVTKDNVIVAYEARVQLGGKVSEIRVGADGKYLGVEGSDDDDKAATNKKARP